MVNPMRLSTYQRMKKIMGYPMLFIVFSFLYPASYLLEINSHVYTSDQIIATLIFVLLVSVITALAVGICVRYFVKVTLLDAQKLGLKTDIDSISSRLYRALLCGFGTIILLVLLLITIQTLIADNVLFVGLCILLTLGVPVLTYRFNVIRYFNLSLCALIVFNCALGVYHGFMGESLKRDKQKMEQEVVFKQKPNVYLVILESSASLDIRKEIYGIDNAPLTRELEDKNYNIYKSYACYNSTLPSLASIFLMDHHYYKHSRGLADGGGYRKIIGGVVNNHVMNIFLNNGYRIDYSKFPSSLYQPSPAVSTEIQPLLQPIEVFYGLFAISHKFLNHPLWSSAFFQSLIRFPEKITGKSLKSAEKRKIENDGRPVFSLIYQGGVPHSNSFFSEYPPEIRDLPGAHQLSIWQLNRVNNNWISTYKNSVAKTDQAVIGLIRDLSEKDPKAIVILVGDHGPNFNRNRWMGEKDDPNENMLENGIQPAEVTRDIFEVLMAIKWPDGMKEPHVYFSHVNLFRHVFAVLAKNHAILKIKVSNDSFMRSDYLYTKTKGVYYTMKDGKLLERWEPFTIPIAQ